MHSGTTTWHKEEVMKHIKVPVRRLTTLSLTAAPATAAALSS